MTEVRTRFAPSPTGFMHVGNLRTGLFAWLTARHAGGTFILRLEDTDKNREVEGSAEHILACLNMLGLDRDEGVDVGGPYAPYKQSERLEIYKQWAQKLIDAGRAYADPYSAEEVQKFREEAQAQKRPFLYRNHRPDSPPAWDGSAPLRFKVDTNPKHMFWHDAVMGEIRFTDANLDDFIMIKSDGYPTYNFAHVIDDITMKITHVIRGQEFISSTPNYLNVYEALNKIYPESLRYLHNETPGDSFEERLRDGVLKPVFASVPHIMNEQGNKKLGKRDGARDVLSYIDEGFLPETMLSFIATLGWNDGTEQEVFSRDDLKAKFSLDRVQRSGARFDEKRLLWMNGQFIRELSLDDLWSRIENFWPGEANGAEESYKRQVLTLAQDRLKTLTDLPILTSYFFDEPTPEWSMIDSNKQLAKLDRARHIELLNATKTKLEATDFKADNIQQALNELLESTGEKPGTLFSLVRFAITWAPFSPALPETIEVIGRDRTLARLEKALESA